MSGRLCLVTTSLALAAAVVAPAGGQSRSELELARKKLVEEAVVGSGIKDPRVVDAMLRTPRHEFVPPHVRSQAYLDMALPIGAKQTISSPFIVAYMTQLLDPQPSDKVLEIGTGSGYQAAVLSGLVKEVYTIEIVASLGRRAQRTLKNLGYDNVFVRIGDGYKGWPGHAPFDKIIVTCSPENVPQPLVQQLQEGGLMIIPVGQRHQQTLYLLRKREGKLVTEALRPTLFVPMTGAAEDRRRIKPDPLHPQTVNGGFEETPINRFLPGWYYQRQATRQTAPDAPEGRHFVSFENQQDGREANALQGFAIDGRRVTHLAVSAWVKLDNVQVSPTREDYPTVAVSFYDEHRKQLGLRTLGPLQGTRDWHQVSDKLRVPIQAREGILRIGLFGATGTLSFDDVRIKAAGS